MSDNKETKLKGIIKELKGKKGDKDLDVQIRTKGGNEEKIEFTKSGEELKSTSKTFQYRIKDKDGKWNDGDWKDFDSEVKWTGGAFTNSVELLEKKVATDIDLKETVKPGMGLGYLTWISWASIVVLVIAVIALIWWWVASSRSEDKEEEGL